MKIGFIIPCKLTWSLVWRATILGMTVMIWGYIIFVFSLFGLLAMDSADYLNGYISTNAHNLKSLLSQDLVWLSVTASISLGILFSPIYYYPFQQLNTLSYKSFTLHFYKNDHSTTAIAMFIPFYILFMGLNLFLYGLASLSGITVISDLTEILSLFTCFSILCRTSLFGYHFHLAPKAA